MTGLLLDVIVAVLLVLLVLFGIWRGMYKLIFGLISALLAIVLAVAMVSPITTFVIDHTTLDEKVTVWIDEPMTSSFPNAGKTVQLYTDADGELVLGYENEGEMRPVSELFEGAGAWSFFGGITESFLMGRMEEGETEVIGDVLVSSVVGVIMLVVVFVILLIIFTIVVKILMHLLRKAVTKTYFGYFVDKLIGGVLGLVIAGVIIFGALTIVRLLGTYEWIIPVNAVIEDSALTKYLFQNNFIYAILTEAFDIKGIIDSVIGLAGKAGGGS